MSWDADLVIGPCCPHCGGAVSAEGHSIYSWNYTHNTNGMIAAAYETATGEATEQASGPLGPAIGAAWWKQLDGEYGAGGALYLAVIIRALEADPGRYRAMNPENGWGDYDGILETLREMRKAGAAEPHASWSVSG
jgi:hypothetical protein